MSRIVFVNGEYTLEEKATISIFDRGFIFADGVYEVVPVIGGKMFDKAPFLARLERSLDELGMAMPMSGDEYIAMHEELIKRNDLQEGGIYSQITRGVADREFPYPKDIKQTVVAFTQMRPLLETTAAQNGAKVVCVEDIRWKRRDIKSIALLAQVMVKQQAVEQGANEAWMIEGGYITEGASSSAYIIKDGKVITRPLSNDILPGIRRQTLLQLSKEHQITIEERLFTMEEAMGADEACMSSASTFVTGIVEIDGTVIGDGKVGPITRRMREIYIDNAKKEVGLI